MAIDNNHITIIGFRQPAIQTIIYVQYIFGISEEIISFLDRINGPVTRQAGPDTDINIIFIRVKQEKLPLKGIIIFKSLRPACDLQWN